MSNRSYMPVDDEFDGGGGSYYSDEEKRIIMLLTAFTPRQLREVVGWVSQKGGNAYNIVEHCRRTNKAPPPILGLVEIDGDRAPIVVDALMRATSALLIHVMGDNFTSAKWTEIFTAILGDTRASTVDYYKDHVDVPTEGVLDSASVWNQIVNGALTIAGSAGSTWAGRVIGYLTEGELDKFIQEQVNEAPPPKLPQMYRFGLILKAMLRDVNMALHGVMERSQGTFLAESGGPTVAERMMMAHERGGPQHDGNVAKLIDEIRRMGGPARVVAMAAHAMPTLHALGYDANGEMTSGDAIRHGQSHVHRFRDPHALRMIQTATRAQYLRDWMAANPSIVRSAAPLFAADIESGGYTVQGARARYGAIESGGPEIGAASLVEATEGALPLLAFMDVNAQTPVGQAYRKFLIVKAMVNRHLEKGGPTMADDPVTLHK